MKIPLYNKGIGGTGVTRAGTLGPRATSGAFTGVGQSLAAFGKEADRIATDFFDAEAQSVADDATTKATLEYKEKISEFNRTNGSLSVAEYDKKFEQFKNIELNIARSKYKLRKDFQQKFNNSLEVISANGKQIGRQETHRKGTSIRAQNSQSSMSTLIDELVTTKDENVKNRILRDMDSRVKTDLANGYTPYVKYKTLEDAKKEADKRGLFIDINDEDKTIDDLMAMKKEVLDPTNPKYTGYSAGERETFNAKIQERINYLRTGVTANLEQSYLDTKSSIMKDPDNADTYIDTLEKSYLKLGVEGERLFASKKFELVVQKGITQRTKPYELESNSSMQAAILEQETKWKASKPEDAAEELAILQGMKKTFAENLEARKGDVVGYIKAKQGADLSTSDLLATQRRMGIPENQLKVKTGDDIRKIFNEYNSMEASEASAFLKNVVENDPNKTILVRQMMESGHFGAHENLTMIDPLSSLNNTFIAAKKGDELIKANTTQQDRMAINQIVAEEFADFRKSHIGAEITGSVLSRGGRSGSIDKVQMAIIKTAHYIKATDPTLSNSDAADAALKIINNSYDIRTINGGTYRMKNDIVAPNEQAIVHDSLKRIITNRNALRNKIQVPEGKTFETYINQAGRQLRWQTNEEEDGVFLVNGGAADSFVLDKQGNRIEYKFSDLAAQVMKTKKEKEEEIVIQTRTRLEKRQKQLQLRNTRTK